MLELVRVIVQPNWDLGLRSIGRIKRRIDITNQGLVLALEDNDTITGHELAVLLLFNSVVVRSLGAGLFCQGAVVRLLCRGGRLFGGRSRLGSLGRQAPLRRGWHGL